jgi:hypothetical protein
VLIEGVSLIVSLRCRHFSRKLSFLLIGPRPQDESPMTIVRLTGHRIN